MSLCVLGKHHRQLGSTLLDLIKVSAKGRERFSLTFPAWHLPKVLILQSASARAGADRTFSDQYLGQVPEGCQAGKVKEKRSRPLALTLMRSSRVEPSWRWCFPKTHSDKNSATGTRTRVVRVRAEYPSQLDYSGRCNLFFMLLTLQLHTALT